MDRNLGQDTYLHGLFVAWSRVGFTVHFLEASSMSERQDCG